MRLLASLIAVAMVIGLSPANSSAASSHCDWVDLQPTDSNLPLIEAATVCLIDEVREHRHLHLLRVNPDLHAVAVGQASEMVLGDYFGDDSRNGQTPLQRIVATSYPSHAARVSTAQNIGWGTYTSATPLGMFEAWMSSPPHRRLILTPGYRDIGVGVTPAVPSKVAPGATYTVEFGVRRTPK